MEKKILISTSTFAQFDKTPLELLEQQGLIHILNPHRRKLKKEEILDLARETIGIVAGTESFTNDVFEQLPDLQVISRCGSGMDNVDLAAAKKLGIKVFNTSDGPTVAVAELTVGLILNLLRKINQMDCSLRNGEWKKLMGNLLSGKKVGLIGFGRIGGKVAQLLSTFGPELAYYDPNIKDGILGFKNLPLEELLGWADIVSLHVSGSREILGQKEFKQMKKGSFLIHCSRGGVVNEKALYEALQTNILAGAAIDVFEKEPYTGNLKELDNVILTPHIGSYAKEARIKMEYDAVCNLLAGLKKCDK